MPDASTNVERAVDAYDALQRHFYDSGKKLYHEANGNHAYVWPFSQALAATVDLAHLPGVGARFQDDLAQRLEGLSHYWNGRSRPAGYDAEVRSWFGGGGDQYYDDNEWVGLELVRVHQLTGDADALEQAKKVFTFVVDGWDDDPSHAAPGGVFWTRRAAIRDRNTVSNAPGALLGLRLYELSQERDYLDWATRMYDWVNQHLRQPDDLYSDHIDLSGTIDRGPWSYNQGTMAGAGVLLARATGDSAHLDQARRTADAALAFYAEGERLERQGPAFNAIFFKNLLLVGEATDTAAYRRAMAAYADRIWSNKRDAGTGLIVPDPRRGPAVLEQSAMIQIYASLAATESGK